MSAVNDLMTGPLYASAPRHRGRVAAMLDVAINGTAEFEIPVTVVVRNPILRIVHRGQGGGRVWAEYDDNACDYSVEYRAHLQGDLP
jgi:hypothetical protein